MKNRPAATAVADAPALWTNPFLQNFNFLSLLSISVQVKYNIN